ncbi:hypothetical protein CGZ80_20305 [Rhodopirellula sp. MGV]|nr:hypothetical protein CGZ80_20305 [Rhodopirellula sp. MGV]
MTQADLRQQIAAFETSEDKNTEHYRCAAFREYLNRCDAISDQTFHDLLALTDAGPDECDLSLNRAFDLVHSELLTESQLRWLRDRSGYGQHTSFRVVIDRILIGRRLTCEGLTGSVFQEICAFNDATTIQQLLDHDDLTRDHVAWVAEHGCNKRLRNFATQLLSSRRFQNCG